MKGGTLMISRAVKNHSYYKGRLEALGFSNVTLTALEKDGLNSLIRDLEPELIMMGARFYECSTPYMMGELKKQFPKIKMAALSIGEYPPDLAMYFILNGAKAYATTFDGLDEWYKGLEAVRRGREYISPAVQERINMRREYPEPAGSITGRQREIILLMCNGFKDVEIAHTLYITRRTVTTHKTEIFRSLNVRSPNELIRTALHHGIVKLEGLSFYPNDFILTPLPEKKILKRGKKSGNR